jgi:hypothetical protein
MKKEFHPSSGLFMNYEHEKVKTKKQENKEYGNFQ